MEGLAESMREQPAMPRFQNVAAMVSIGVNEDGYREVIGCAEGFTESKERWRAFLSWLKSRGLRGVRMFTGDKAAGMVGSIAEVFPGAKYQRCTVHFYRNALAKVPKSKRSQVAAMLKAIHAMKSRDASAAKAESVAAELESMKLKEAAKVVREGFAETLTYCEMPREHWRRIRTNNAIERLNREKQGDKARTRVVDTFPVSPHAGGSPPEVRRRQRMGIAPLPGHVASQGAAMLTAGEFAQNC